MMKTRLTGDDRLPLYQRLADSLRAEISSGNWRPGDRVPSENDLAAEYNLAAGTVRMALAQLVDENLLERSHGRGTFVRRPNFDRSLFRFFRFRTEDGETVIPESRILHRAVEPAPSYIAGKLAMQSGSDAIRISRLRLINDEPVLAEEIWLPVDRFRPMIDFPAEQIGPLLYPLYDTHCGQLVTHAEEALTAETADKAMASLLKTKTSAPLIVIERLARSFDNSPIEWRRSRGKAEHFHYQTEIR